MRWISTTFKTSEKSTALDFISLVACNLLHEIRNRWCEEWCSELYLVTPRTAGYSINLWATLCAEWNLSCIKMHATMSYYTKPQKVRWLFPMFKTSEKSTALYFMQPRSVQLVARNQESLMWRMTFGVTLGQSANGTVFDKSVGNIVCGVESVVHQDARYHTLIY